LKLGKAGIVKSSRGIQGGFILARPAAEISLGAILRILEGVPFQDTCDHFNRKTDCGHLSDCSIRPVWQIVSRRLWDVVDKINLAQLILDEKNVRQRLLVELPVLNQ
jgi:Rrf2 family transcriptional regulator, iron-sulfur cluster assembly transcription factor